MSRFTVGLERRVSSPILIAHAPAMNGALWQAPCSAGRTIRLLPARASTGPPEAAGATALFEPLPRLTRNGSRMTEEPGDTGEERYTARPGRFSDLSFLRSS